jgi:hypothetical protein
LEEGRRRYGVGCEVGIREMGVFDLVAVTVGRAYSDTQHPECCPAVLYRSVFEVASFISESRRVSSMLSSTCYTEHHFYRSELNMLLCASDQRLTTSDTLYV